MAKEVAEGMLEVVNVATRTNALWQRVESEEDTGGEQSRNPHECAVAKEYKDWKNNSVCSRNPHECAVAKSDSVAAVNRVTMSQPARMRCGKEEIGSKYGKHSGRNPHECAVAKSTVTPFICTFTVATRTNALWQR